MFVVTLEKTPVNIFMIVFTKDPGTRYLPAPACGTNIFCIEKLSSRSEDTQCFVSLKIC